MQSISKWGAAFSFVAVMTLSACEAPPTMRVASPEVVAGSDVVIQFATPLAGQAANQYWITMLPTGTVESDVTGRRFVYHGDTSARLPAPQVGSYQVRLHDQFPQKEHQLIATTAVQVVARQE